MPVTGLPFPPFHRSSHGPTRPDGADNSDQTRPVPLAKHAPEPIGSRRKLAEGMSNTSIDTPNMTDCFESSGTALESAAAAKDDSSAVPRALVHSTDNGAPDEGNNPGTPGPFHKWMRSLHRKARRRPSVGVHVTGTLPHWFWVPDQEEAIGSQGSIHGKMSSSGSSFKFVSAIRTASASLASVSVVARSKKNAAPSQCVSRTDRSSRASMSGPRASEDSAMLDKADAVDAEATERAIQRRRILEELISTEEGYIGDVRFLMNVYVTLLASLPATCMGLRSSINLNLTEIIELHEEILGELHRVIPYSEYTQPEMPVHRLFATNQAPISTQAHRRWASLDTTPTRGRRAAHHLHTIPGMVAEPQVGAEVAKVFAKRMKRFFIYEEYGAKYEMMVKDVASAHEVMPQWDSYQKGLEALAATLGSGKSANDRSRNALSIGDLLVKPIQRMCKYPLLFAELLKHTPVSDCPNSHMEVEGALTRLREATGEINRATNDSRMKATLERTWLLQDRLVFPNERLDASSKNRIRSLGHIQLCGTLHICWQCTQGVDGQYLICLLYRHVLCLASAGKADQIYIIQVCVNLSGARVEHVDNGRGLQCHTAPFSWKLVFECDGQLHEMIMTACTPKEEMEWRARLARLVQDSADAKEGGMCSSLNLKMKSLGTVLIKAGGSGTISRRGSIHRATTVGPKSPLCQVILKNTSITRDSSNASASLTISRSQSLLTTNARMPVLAPARGERARLESLLGDVWSREILPFPGMTARARSEHLVRTSASTVMRKLSVASITSTFAKKSGSLTQRSKAADGADEASNGSGCRRRVWRGSTDEAEVVDEGERASTVRRTKKTRTARCLGIQSAAASGSDDIARAASTSTPRRAGTGKGKRDGEESIALRPSSANSLRLSRSTRSDKGNRRRMEKENKALEAEEKLPTQAWRSKLGVTRNQGGNHSFRNLFR